MSSIELEGCYKLLFPTKNCDIARKVVLFTMTRQEIISQISALLRQLEDEEPTEKEIENNSEKPLELLTIKECAEAVKGISEHTIRQLVAQNKVPYIRTGQGKRGKILISKSALLDFFAK